MSADETVCGAFQESKARFLDWASVDVARDLDIYMHVNGEQPRRLPKEFAVDEDVKFELMLPFYSTTTKGLRCSVVHSLLATPLAANDPADPRVLMFQATLPKVRADLISEPVTLLGGGDAYCNTNLDPWTEMSFMDIRIFKRDIPEGAGFLTLTVHKDLQQFSEVPLVRGIKLDRAEANKDDVDAYVKALTRVSHEPVSEEDGIFYRLVVGVHKEGEHSFLSSVYEQYMRSAHYNLFQEARPKATFVDRAHLNVGDSPAASGDAVWRDLMADVRKAGFVDIGSKRSRSRSF